MNDRHKGIEAQRHKGNGCRFCAGCSGPEIVEYLGIKETFDTCWFCGRRLEGE